ncbi:hypothetical protein KW805_03185 [Candidatus Pacearchaeota archaeon]|nr:hypothetical protein [Candidatus Pacearchaeota archaeon]
MEKLHVSLIIEILGRPAEHVKEALNTLVIKLGSEKGVKILEKTYHDPVAVKDAKDLFTAFAEVVVELDSIMNYFGIIFAYLPAHIEIISPESTTLKNVELNEVGHRLVQRLHDYDAITKNALMEKDFLVQKLNQLAPGMVEKIFNPQAKPAKKETKKPKKKK